MANITSPALPQYWALTGLRRLFQLTPGVASVNRQFAPQLARAGQQINAWRADKRTTRRMEAADGYVAADANLTAVPVVLDQYFFDSFVILDEEEALTIPELSRIHMMPAIESIARGIDRAILGRVHSFLRQGSPNKRAGRLQSITKDNASDYILEAEEVLAGNLAPMEGLRTAIVHHTTNTKLMGSPEFSRSDARAVSPTILTGSVGVVYNTRVVMSQNVNYCRVGSADTATTAINNAAGYAEGETGALTVDTGLTWTVGEYVNVEGNDQPTFITASGASTNITLNEELKYSVADNAVVTQYKKGTNEAVVRAVGYQKPMTLTHSSGKNVQQGQLVSFGTGGSRHTYTVIEVSATTATTTTVLLDRPLEIQVGSGDDFFPGPAGAMNPVLHEDAIAFVSRPMQAVQRGAGANSGVANFRGVGLRVVIQYDSSAGGHRVNVDVLAGVSVLDEDLLCVMCA